MDLFEMMNATARRKWLVVSVLVLTAVIAWAAQRMTASEWSASGHLVLERPELSADRDPVRAINPVDLAQRLAQQPEWQAINFSAVGQDDDTFRLAASGDSAEEAVDNVDTVLREVTSRFLSQQRRQGVAEQELATLHATTPQALAREVFDGSYFADAVVNVRDPASQAPNPYLPNDSTGRLLTVAVTGEAARQAFVDRVGPGITFSVGQASGDAASLIEVSTVGHDRDSLIDAFHEVEAMLAEELERIQERAEVLERERLTLAAVDEPVEVELRSPPVKRLTAIVLVVGSLAAVGLPLRLETMQRRRVARSMEDSPRARDAYGHGADEMHALAGSSSASEGS